MTQKPLEAEPFATVAPFASLAPKHEFTARVPHALDALILLEHCAATTLLTCAKAVEVAVLAPATLE